VCVRIIVVAVLTLAFCVLAIWTRLHSNTNSQFNSNLIGISTLEDMGFLFSLAGN